MSELERAKKYAAIPSNGAEFEAFLAMLFRDLGFRVKTTPASGDYGADLILTNRASTKHAVQAKFYNSGAIGVSPIQEVYASLAHWRADDGWVVTNGSFTKAARKLAGENKVRLIDGRELNKLIGLALDGVILDENIEGEKGSANEPISTDAQILKANRNKSPMDELIFQANELLSALKKHGGSIRLIIMSYCFAGLHITQEMQELYISIRQFKHKHIDWGFACEEDNALNSNKLTLQCITWTDAADVSGQDVERYREQLSHVEVYARELERTDEEAIARAARESVDLRYLDYDKYQINEAVLPKIKELEDDAKRYAMFSDAWREICRLGKSAVDIDKASNRERFYEAVSNAKTNPDFASIAGASTIFDQVEAIMHKFDARRAGSADRKISSKPLWSLFQKSQKLFDSYKYRVAKIKDLYSNVRFDDKEDFLILAGAEALIDVQLETQDIESDFQASINELSSIIAKQQSLQESIYLEENNRLRNVYENEIGEYRQSFEKLLSKHRDTNLRMLKKSREKKLVECYKAIQSVNARWNQESCIQLYAPTLPEGIELD